MIEDILSEKTKIEALNLLKEGFGWKKEKKFKYFLLNKKNQNNKRLGVLFKYNSIAVGVILLFEKDRIIDSNYYKFINFSSWYFKEEYRAFAPILIKKIISKSPENSVLTNFTPHSSAINIFKKFGFNHFDVRFSPININILKYFSSIKIRKINTNIPNSIPKNIQDIFKNLSSKNIYKFGIYDHLKSETCFFVLCFFRKKGIKFARILFANNPDILVKNLSKINLYLLINCRSFGLLFPNFGSYKSVSWSFKTNGKYLFKSTQKFDCIDLLFSEFTELLN